MVQKRLLVPEQARCIPKGNFSWVDQRLLFQGHLTKLNSPEALALYLFLVLAADAQGLSYYSDQKAARLLSMDRATFTKARAALQHAGLIAYQRPLYQLLSLDTPPPLKPRYSRAATEPQSIADIFRSIACNGTRR